MMTDKEILAIYDQGPEAVLKLVKGLFEVIERQNKIIEQQSQRIQLLEKRLQELETRLNKNSQNSSKPPSSDIFRNNQNNSREKTGKKPGGQTGHKANRIELSNHPDEIIIHRVDKCSNCSRLLAHMPAIEFERRQILEIPIMKLKVIEHQSEVKICHHCNQITKGVFPCELSGKVQYGKAVNSFITACQNYLLLPYRRTAEFFEYLFDHKISQGTLKNINEKFYNALEQTELKIKQAVTNSKVINQDETGIYINGQRLWLHASSTKELTFYEFHTNRGKKAFEAIGIIPVYKGNLIHDYWKPYLGYNNCNHYLCNAHHLRELKFIVETDHNQKWASEMRKFLKQSKISVERAKIKDKENLSSYLLKKYELLYEKILRKALRENPENKDRETKRGRIKQSLSRLLFERFRDHKDMVLGFLYDFNIPFDNNLVERDLRMMKLKQKISGCFRTEDGARYFCRIRGYISTVKKQGINIFDALTSVLNGNILLNL